MISVRQMDGIAKNGDLSIEAEFAIISFIFGKIMIECFDHAGAYSGLCSHTINQVPIPSTKADY